MNKNPVVKYFEVAAAYGDFKKFGYEKVDRGILHIIFE